MRFWPLFSALAATGCSHYALPINRLESPESLGAHASGQLELLGLRSGANLTDPPTQDAPDATTGAVADPRLGTSLLSPSLGAWGGISERFDVGIRLGPKAPLLLRGRWQFTGEPASRAAAGNFSFAAIGGFGLYRGSVAGQSGTSLDAGLIAGYRLADQHLLFGGPFFGMASVGGVTRAQASGTGTVTGPGVSGSAFGAGVGYEYWLQSFLPLRVELAYASGSSGEAKLGGISLGFLVAYPL